MVRKASEIDINKLVFISSNPMKIAEFKRLLRGYTLKVRKGKDLHEVNGNSIQVVTYKCLDAGENNIVDDTILEINNKEVVDIRWKLTQLKNMKERPTAIWKTTLGFLQNNKIYIFQGVVEGIIEPNPNSTAGFGFEPWFIPDGTKYTLSELRKIGKYDDYNARKKAIDKLLKKEPTKVILSNHVKKWNGKYQHESCIFNENVFIPRFNNKYFHFSWK